MREFINVILRENAEEPRLVEGPWINGRCVVRLPDGSPPRRLYRIMSREEYDAGMRSGQFVSHDGRVHASIKPEFSHAVGYGVVLVAIDYRDEDGWKAKWGMAGSTLYAITSDPIAASRVHIIGAGDRYDLERAWGGHSVRTPGVSLTPAIRVGNRLYRAPPGETHSYIVNRLLTPEQREEMEEQELNPFVFVDHRGHILERDRAVDYALDNDLVLPRYRDMLERGRGHNGLAADFLKGRGYDRVDETPEPRSLINIDEGAQEGSPADLLTDEFFDTMDASPVEQYGHTSLREVNDRTVEIISILARTKRKGYGSTVLSLLCNLADKHGVTLVLSPAEDADGMDGGMEYDELCDWYASYGFEYGRRMVRRPEPLQESIGEIKREAEASRVELRLIDAGQTIWVKWLANRGQRGAARAVMERLCEFADQHDKRLTLDVLDGDPDLIRYYEGFGFRVDGLTRDDAEPRMMRQPRARLDERAADLGWFAGSRVVDRKGQPLVCYHGGNTPIETFRPWTHFGTAVAANQRVGFKYGPHGSIVYPVYLRIINPLRVTDMEASDEATLLHAIVRGEYPDIDGALARREGVIAACEAAGYDGLVYRNIVEHRGRLSWVIFRSDQVRLAV